MAFDPAPSSEGKAEVCEHCGAKVVEYRHSLGRPLVAGLAALHDAGGSAKLKDLNLTLSQANNFQKLRYWNLAKQGAGCVWSITHLGLGFLEGTHKVRKVARTFRGEVVGYEGPEVTAREVSGHTHYRKRGDYAGDAVVHGG